MEILKFIFLLGINFSIFGFIWGVIMLGVRLFQSAGPRNQSLDYVLRIVKYFLLVSVTANFISNMEPSQVGINSKTTLIIVGAIVLALYLLGKLQNRAVLQQLGQNPLFARFANTIDPKVERFLLLGSVTYFVFCLLYPQMVDNGLVNWFSDSIVNIYDTPIIGWVFSVIAFFFLINTLMRAANVVSRLLNGQSLTSGTQNKRFDSNQKPFSNTTNQSSEDGFADYEDVTDDNEN